MARLNKRQLKKLNKKRAKALTTLLRNEITKEIDREIIEQLQRVSRLITVKSDHMHMVDWVHEEGQPEIFIGEEALKMIGEHSK